MGDGGRHAHTQETLGESERNAVSVCVLAFCPFMHVNIACICVNVFLFEKGREGGERERE